jgi:putative ABC transport system permease protein
VAGRDTLGAAIEMTPRHSPPRLARRLLGLVLPDDVRDAIDGDLFELFTQRNAERGWLGASIWYWREAVSFTVRFTSYRAYTFLNWLLRGDAPSGLDFKLGSRMLIKYPGLSIIGGLGMACAIAIGAGVHAIFYTYVHPQLPLHEGDRIVAVVNVNYGAGGEAKRVLHDFVDWRSSLKSVVDLTAFRTVSRDLVAPQGPNARVVVAEMSASGFRVARVAPLIGRPFLETDETIDGPPVVVIGHRVWLERFNGDPGAIGQTLMLSHVPHTVVGVMPEGFRFPINYDFWVPLRLRPTVYEYGRGPELDVFGRLAPGTSTREAQAELNVIGQRTATAHPKERRSVRPRVTRFTSLYAGDAGTPSWMFGMVDLGLTLVLLLVGVNVAILVYARTTTRLGEIAVRTALGASRRRIVTQLFAEALVLSLVAAAVGLAIVSFALRQVASFEPNGAPFWSATGLSVRTVLYAVFLALVAAVVTGVLPALRATGTQLRTALGRLSGGTKPQLGRMWTALIVAQVAITVAALPFAAYLAGMFMRQGTQEIALPAGEFLAARLVLDREDDPVSDEERGTSPFVRKSVDAVASLARRIEAEPAVAAVMFAQALPGNEWAEAFDVSSGTASDVRTARIGRAVRVSTNYLQTFDVRLLSGRTFSALDTAPGVLRPVIVNQTAAEEFFGGVPSSLGRRIRVRVWRDSVNRNPWAEVVGVVEDFPPVGFGDPGDPKAKVYQPAAPSELHDRMIVVRLKPGGDASFATTMRAIASAVDPMLQLRQLSTLESRFRDEKRALFLLSLGVMVGILSIVLLSAAGVYALMSFTVTQRQREIGVRVALGAGSRRILTSILSRAAAQLAVGIVAGLALTVTIDLLVLGLYRTREGAWFIAGVAVFIALVGALAAFGPARRILAVQPTEALRADS